MRIILKKKTLDFPFHNNKSILKTGLIKNSKNLFTKKITNIQHSVQYWNSTLCLECFLNYRFPSNSPYVRLFLKSYWVKIIQYSWTYKTLTDRHFHSTTSKLNTTNILIFFSKNLWSKLSMLSTAIIINKKFLSFNESRNNVWRQRDKSEIGYDYEKRLTNWGF